MNCGECEQLFDAYLDGQLAGSLRLEFDAHRLRCRRCQQALAMLEAVGHVIAADTEAPDLSEDFTARVMREVTPPASAEPRRIEIPWTRVAVVTAALAQAAAILLVAVMWNTPAPVPESTPGDELASAVAPADPTDDPAYQALHSEITGRIEDRIWDMHHAGARLTSDVLNLAQYLDIKVPEDYAREASEMANSNPWDYFWGSVKPPAEDEPEADASADDLHSI